ncbi:adenosine deaminase [Francisella adeliensis]|uniref:Adenine deaminase n=1 Tax=Francisella adeliensis TaxID=2007306 RepID=A0A2Z4XY84_9GAMM|nr:adenosine deaminase [Francisella adeliensis]AXA33714.1 adenosine deaminase [Francisella adeliensis]MBK2085610.1 adenosine deaminase [Francisella adeliensis]MBK2097488.1 adenosine deaminase [Francisella adeliensis]QIW11948.1 adenosine deaminase [Francisella adeliensis]QIW13824.1 adenosine deaminase [Francisella adeliensis]
MFDQKLLAKPKAELHMHIEGSLEPKMMFKLAKRNNIPLKYKTIEEIKKAYSFNNLQQFLDLYYQGMSVLITERDFYDLTYAYLQKAADENITHTEMFFDPQAHLERKINLQNVFMGINKAIQQAEIDFGIKASLIVCFLRHLSEKSALECFEQVMNYRELFIGIGLDSSELGNPPTKFKNLFNLARKEDLFLVAHAGEEGPAEYVWQALDILGVDRIDHGNAIITDKELIQRIIKDDIALTMCPLSNKSLKVTPDLKDYPAKLLLDMGVKVTINSDDPAYFGGYLNENYKQLASSLNLTNNDINKLIQNSLDARFIK